MVTLVLRRAFVQRRLLVALVLLVAVAATLVGVCSLLLGVTAGRAFHAEALRAQPEDVDVTAYVVDLSGADLSPAREEAARVVQQVLAPLRPSLASTATARMRRLDDTDRLAYLATDDPVDQRAELTSGRWPAATDTGPYEAVVPDPTARLLGLRLGDQVSLGHETGLGGAAEPVPVVVVGTFRPTDRAGWAADPLAGNGFDPAYSDGSVTAPAYGPFVVADGSFRASGSSVTGLQVTGDPTLALADESTLSEASSSLDHATTLLSARVGDRARTVRVASALPETLDQLRAQQASTRATVLVVLLMGTALALAAVVLAGWLVASVRDDERALLVTFGLSRGQQLGAALVEGLLVAAVAALLAVPAAAVLHSRLTHLPALRAAGLAQPVTVSWALAAAVLASATLFAVVLVGSALDAGTARRPVTRRRAVARSGLDVLLLAVALLGWWELRSQPPTSALRGDVTLTLAPVVCLAAVTLLAVRLVPVALGRAARLGARSRSLVPLLATHQAARRPRTGTAMVLVAAAVAAAVFALAVRATWERSQDDQAALRVGTDLSLTLVDPAELTDAAAVAGATRAQHGGEVVSPVVDRPIALGSFVGAAGAAPMVVAVDARHAGALLRGRLEPGTSWGEVGSRLAPDAPVRGLALPEGGTGVELQGSTSAGTDLVVTPTAVVQDADGFRGSLTGRPVPLDGRPHQVEWLRPPPAGLELVGLRMELDGPPGEVTGHGAPRPARVGIAVRVPGSGDAGVWHALPSPRDSLVRGATLTVVPSADSTELRTTARVDAEYLAYSDATITETAFPAPPAVPVAVSQDLAGAVGAKPGSTLSAIVDDTTLSLRVVAVVPTVPSAPGRAAVLADVDTLSRALIDSGRIDPVVDGWWVAQPTAGTAESLRALDLGPVSTRRAVATQLSQGPVRVTVPAALVALVVAAAAMLLAGVTLLLSADRQRRSAEVARLRALGLTRRESRRALLAEQAAFLAPLVVVGGLVGLTAAVALGPHLIRSDVGAAPVPAAVVAWPWTAELLLVGSVVLAVVAISAVATAVHVRRSDPALLRTGDG